MNTDNLIEFRKDLNLKQYQLAKLIGVSRATYTRYENGTKKISVKNLNTISNKYDKSLDFLAGIKRTNNPNFKHIEIDYIEIGKRLKQIRLKEKLSQEILHNHQ